jgi:hypothetical protein
MTLPAQTLGAAMCWTKVINKDTQCHATARTTVAPSVFWDTEIKDARGTMTSAQRRSGDTSHCNLDALLEA